MRLLFKFPTVKFYLFLEAGGKYQCPGDTAIKFLTDNRLIAACCPPET